MSAFAIEHEVNYGAPESHKVEWASSGASESKPEKEPIRVARDYATSKRFLSLPRFKDVDILDLIRLAEDISHCHVGDRVTAIEILVGREPLDSPLLQSRMILALAPGMPKYL